MDGISTLTVTNRVAVVFCVCILAACATGSFRPVDINSVPFRDRAVTQAEGGLRVSAAVPSVEETTALFGAPLYKRGIQPVWLEIENKSSERVRFSPVGLDRDYFSPLEVAYMHRKGLSKSARKEMEYFYYDLGLPRQIPAGESRSGFVFTNAGPGTKSFNVDVISPLEDHSFAFFVDVPGFVPDHAEVDFETLYDPDEIQLLDADGFRSKISSTTSCCTTDMTGKRQGLPWNVLLVGEGSDLLMTLLRADWYETPRRSANRKPEDAHYLFGRQADAVFRIQRDGKRDRNEMSLWLTPFRLDGEPVWIAQITHFIGQKTQIEDFIFGERVDPNVDDSRNYLMQNLWYSQGLKKVGWIETGMSVTIDESAEGFNGVDYFTDGFRAVMWVSGDPVSLNETVNAHWDRPPFR
jgi:hypothetical protein